MPRLRLVSALARRSAVPTLMLLMVLAMLVAVLFSPIGLLWIGRRPGYDWSLLGNVGQTYGAASAILAALALIGVATTLVLQAREAKQSREQSLRALHTDLMKMAIDEPEFLECWGPIGKSADVDWVRKHVYTNLIVSHWQLMWEVDVLSQPHLELLADQFFAGATGRRFWAEARGPRKAAETSRRARRFTAVLDRRYLIALAQGAVQEEGRALDRNAETAHEPRPKDQRAVALIAGALFVAGAAVIGVRMLRRLSPRSREWAANSPSTHPGLDSDGGVASGAGQ